MGAEKLEEKGTCGVVLRGKDSSGEGSGKQAREKALRKRWGLF